MECIYCKHKNNSTRNIFIFLQQLLGGGEIEEMHEVFNNLQAAERSLATVPIFENLLYFLIATRNIPSIKNTIGFRGIIFELVVRLNNAPIRCKILSALPDWAICWGKLVAENKKIPLEMRGRRLVGKRNACSLRNGNEYFPEAVWC